MDHGSGKALSRVMLFVALGGLAALAILAVVAPIIWGASAAELTGISQAPASAQHLLGTDSLGRDVLDRTLVATRLTLLMALGATAIASGAGILIGAGSAVGGRQIRAAGGRLIDALIAFPPIIIALIIVAILKPAVPSVIVAIGIAYVPQFARVSNTLVSGISGRDFISITRLLGVRKGPLLARHIVPNVATSLLVLVSVAFSSSIILGSGLSFIGLGVQSPQFDWGQLLNNGLSVLYVNPWEALGPAVAIALTGVLAGMLAEAVTQLSNPRLVRPRRAALQGLRGARPKDEDRSAEQDRSPLVLSVKDLTVTTEGSDSGTILSAVSFDMRRGERLGIVGESGSGKTMTAMAVVGLTPAGVTWSGSELVTAGVDLTAPGGDRARTALATKVGIVFQDPSTSFNPAIQMGTQLTEAVRHHARASKSEARAKAVDRLREVQVSAASTRMRQYPHELSGGMRQRAMIAMALMSDCELLVADEPTTALDVTVQAEVLRLLTRINKSHGTAILLISHDMGVVTGVCERVLVMYGGIIVEDLPSSDLREGRAVHPYTRALLAATPAIRTSGPRQPLTPIPGSPPRPGSSIAGCPFASRCPQVMDTCRETAPPLQQWSGGHLVACFAAGDPDDSAPAAGRSEDVLPPV
jgi:peptide/nickel transport system permease protein